MVFLRRFEKAQTKLAYALMVSLIAVAVITVVLFVGRTIQGLFGSIYDKLGAVFGSETTASVQPIKQPMKPIKKKKGRKGIIPPSPPQIPPKEPPAKRF
ncbi:MAG: hypothetical protein RUDDFDWM_001905 [Candidatus Fervidibacterota bacterium]